MIPIQNLSPFIKIFVRIIRLAQCVLIYFEQTFIVKLPTRWILYWSFSLREKVANRPDEGLRQARKFPRIFSLQISLTHRP